MEGALAQDADVIPRTWNKLEIVFRPKLQKVCRDPRSIILSLPEHSHDPKQEEARLTKLPHNIALSSPWVVRLESSHIVML